MIDSTARIDVGAEIAADVTIGPWCVIEANVRIGSGTWIDAHVVIKSGTSIGCNNRIYAFCSIGQDPQDRKFTASGRSLLTIGNNNVIREYCSINRGTTHGGGMTTIGDNNWIMAYCHIAHDCHVGNSTVFANNASLAGHVEIADHAILGGFTGVHQFCRLGESSFTSISAVVIKDIPPFVVADGVAARPRGINKVGLQRRGFTPQDIGIIRNAYRVLYRQGNSLRSALDKLAVLASDSRHVDLMLDFIRRSRRGIIR